MEDARNTLRAFLDQQLREARIARDVEWGDYWLKRRMVTVAMENPRLVWEPPTVTPVNTNRLFESFPNLAPGEPPNPTMTMTTMIDVPTSAMRQFGGAYDHVKCDRVIRDCIARLKAAREKESTKQNLGSLFAVVIKVQKDLEALVGNDWQREDAQAEKRVTDDDRYSAEAL